MHLKGLWNVEVVYLIYMLNNWRIICASQTKQNIFVCYKRGGDVSLLSDHNSIIPAQTSAMFLMRFDVLAFVLDYVDSTNAS